MSEMIIYPNEDGGVVLLNPVIECGIPLNEIARKDVPAGKPFLYIPVEQVPQDHTFFESWEADFSSPDGHGIGPQAWFIEQYEAELATLDPEKNSERIAELNAAIAVQQAELNA